MGKALQFDEEVQGRLSSLVGQWEWRSPTDTLASSFGHAGFNITHPRIAKYLEFCLRMQDLPRHLGQHSGRHGDLPGTAQPYCADRACGRSGVASTGRSRGIRDTLQGRYGRNIPS